MSDWPKAVNYYLNADKESNYDKAAEVGLSEEAAGVFRYCCYEVELTLMVNENGSSYVTHFCGVALTEPVSVS